jgi:hypothetical protein
MTQMSDVPGTLVYRGKIFLSKELFHKSQKSKLAWKVPDTKEE